MTSIIDNTDNRLTFAGETEASKPVAILVLAIFSRWHLSRGVRNVQKCIALSVMTVVHTLPSSTASSSQTRTDIIIGQPRLAAAMSRFNCAFMMVMVMVMRS